METKSERFRNRPARKFWENDESTNTEKLPSGQPSDSPTSDLKSPNSTSPKSIKSNKFQFEITFNTALILMIIAIVVALASVILAYYKHQNNEDTVPAEKFFECESQRSSLKETLTDCQQKKDQFYDRLKEVDPEYKEPNEQLDDSIIYKAVRWVLRKSEVVLPFAVAVMNAFLAYPLVLIIVEGIMKIKLNKRSHPLVVFQVVVVWCLSARLVLILNSRHKITWLESFSPMIVFIVIKGFATGLILDPESPILEHSAETGVLNYLQNRKNKAVRQ